VHQEERLQLGDGCHAHPVVDFCNAPNLGAITYTVESIEEQWDSCGIDLRTSCP